MRLSPTKDILPVIRKIAALAEDKRYKAYLVGGFVRDLLLGVKNLDIDVVVVGDALAFARYASDEMGAALVEHKKFGTATLIIPAAPEGKRVKIDIATARKEFYKHPAALPSVEFSSIKDDLYRRDFTINAMAVSIDRKNFGELIDFFEGVKDLERKRIRVLHEKSFIDDPTRIFRAVRFEQRYDFRIDDFTAGLIRNAVKAEMFNRVSGERLREEIELLLKEKEPIKAIKRMKSLDELRFISPKIVFGSEQEEYSRNIKKLKSIYGNYFLAKRPLDLWLVYFMVMTDGLTLSEVLRVCDRFVIRRSDKLRMISAKKSEKKIMALLCAKKEISPSRTYRALEPLSYETLLFIMAKCGGKLVKKRIKDFLEKYNGVRISLRGADLKRLGAQPGPCFATILRKTLDAKIDGLISTRRDELLFAEKQLKRY
ncbi:MAG: CCA tRNA nucleotidyltransferase [Candidatus Omnitrophota bacterium]|nr:CCA tRNA nucleotidyltransferase [Candidatus Omnitrophota bacterium]